MTSFTLGGSPSSIRASAAVWAGFSTSTSSAASDLKAVDTSEFQGSEADTYRARLNSDLVPHLTVASEAWDLVASALRTYATGLEGLQTRMATLAQQHAEQESKVRTARRTYEQDNTTGADTTATSFQNFQQADQQLSSLVTQASGIHQEHRTLLQKCCADIKLAKEKRPVKPPSAWDKFKSKVGDFVDGAKKWIAEHAEALKAISGVLKLISAVAGVLALIPVLAPVCGPIALATGAAALAIDVAVMWATDSWDVKALALDALGLIPGGKALSVLGKAGKLEKASDAVKLAKQARNSASDAANVAKNAAKRFRNGNGGTGSSALNQAKKAAAAKLTDAKTALTAAENAEKQLIDKYKQIDKIWDRIGFGTSVTSTGVTGVTTYQETGSISDALLATGVSALGIKIPGMSDKFKIAQGIINGSVGTIKQGTTMITDPSHREAKDWAKLIRSAGSIGAHTYNATSK